MVRSHAKSDSNDDYANRAHRAGSGGLRDSGLGGLRIVRDPRACWRQWHPGGIDA